MPAEREKVVMFKVGKGRVEEGRNGAPVGYWLPGSRGIELGVVTVELGTTWLATGKGNSETVIVSVVDPLVTVVVPRAS